MNLSDLIKKGGLTKSATMTHATIATLEEEHPLTVAESSTVAVTVKSEPQFDPKMLPTSPELSVDEESRIRSWLAHIQEFDKDIISEMLEKCRNNSDTRWYFLTRSEEVPHTPIFSKQVICCECSYFERINHPCLGHCAKGKPGAVAGIWGTDQRFCEQFKALTSQHGDFDVVPDEHEANGRSPTVTILPVIEDK